MFQKNIPEKGDACAECKDTKELFEQKAFQAGAHIHKDANAWMAPATGTTYHSIWLESVG